MTKGRVALPGGVAAGGERRSLHYAALRSR
jgi:hypothetical protein